MKVVVDQKQNKSSNQAQRKTRPGWPSSSATSVASNNPLLEGAEELLKNEVDEVERGRSGRPPPQALPPLQQSPGRHPGSATTDEQRKRSAYGARQGKPFPRQTQVATKFGPVRSWKVNRCGWPGHKAVCFTSFRGDIMAILTLHWQHDKVQKPLRSWSCEARCCCPISL